MSNGGVTTWVCPDPKAYGQTHHMVPRQGTEKQQWKGQLVCAYCGRTEEEIRREKQ